MKKLDSCLIIKNEEANIKPLMEQLLTFSHEIHITDTGSTDSTLDILNEFVNNYDNVFIHHYEWDMNFSNAKNFSLHYANNTSDYQFWCDGDDLLNDKLLETLNKFVNDDSVECDIYYIKYQYYFGDTNPHFRTSILKTATDLSWHDPIHEFIALIPNIKLSYSYFDNGSLIIHHRKEVHSDRNLQIFQNMEKEKWDFTARNYYYYGVELMQHKLYDSAYNVFKKCIYFKDANDTTDQINALIYMSLISFNDEWVDMFYHLLKQGIYRGDMFFYIGDYYFYQKHNRELAKMWYTCALNYKYNNFNSFNLNKELITISPCLQLGLIAYQEGDYKASIEYNQKVLEFDPDNETAKNNILFLNNTTQ